MHITFCYIYLILHNSKELLNVFFGQINHNYYDRGDEELNLTLTEAELDFDMDLIATDAIEFLLMENA